MTNYHKQPVEAPPVVQEFLSYMIGIKNKSRNTTYEYSVDLRGFFIFYLNSKNRQKSETNAFTEEELQAYMQLNINDVRDIDRINIADYLYFLSNKGLSAPTRARKLSAVRAYFDYMCYKTFRLEDNPCEMVESPVFKRKLPVFLTETECVELLSTIKQTNDKNAARDYLIVALFMCCGLRIDELVGINLTDIRKNIEYEQENLILSLIYFFPLW